MDVKELNDVLDLAEGLGNSLVAAKANDGTVSNKEYLAAALSNAPAAFRAFMGLDQVLLEIKDLDAAESQALVFRLVNLWGIWSKVLMA